MTAKLPTAPTMAVATPGRRRISASGAAGAAATPGGADPSAFRAGRTPAGGGAGAPAPPGCPDPSAFGSRRPAAEIASPTSGNAPAASHGTTSSCGDSGRFANIGPKTTGPQIAPETTPKSTIDIPRAR